MRRYLRLALGLTLVPIILSGCGEIQSSSPSPESLTNPTRMAEPSDRDWFRQLSTSDFDSVIQASRGHYVVLVRNDNCRPCNEMSRSIYSALELRPDSVSVGTVDTDSNPELTDELRIRTVPTTLLYHDGALVSRVEGSMSARKFTDWFLLHAS